MLAGAAPRQDNNVLNFDEIVERYQAPLLRFLFGLVGDRELAADLCQDTFLSVFRALDRIHPGAQLDAWMFTIALNHARGALRRRRLVRWVPFVNLVHDRASGKDLATQVAAQEQLRELLDELPTDQRACVLLHAEGFRYVEIGHVLGCSVAAVKLRIFRARRHLLEVYGPGAAATFQEDA